MSILWRKLLKPSFNNITVGARKSPLSQAQVKEVLQEIRRYHPDIEFKCIFSETKGDKDQKTSLRALEKTNFFTQEIDDLVLTGQCQIGVHSAKDLPDPLPEGLVIIAMTKGLDPTDSLVLREHERLKDLPTDSIIATSSERREAMVKQLRLDLKFKDLRGSIHQRLDKLTTGEADGVVVAEAALIRLGLTHLNRIRLPGETSPFQGRLAILALRNNLEMQQMFACIDAR